MKRCLFMKSCCAHRQKPRAETTQQELVKDMTQQQKILVIKLGALGDMIQAMGAIQAVRRHHPQAHITFLTTKPFAQMGRDCGYFDAVQIDARPKWHQPGCWMSLRSWFQENRFDRV